MEKRKDVFDIGDDDNNNERVDERSPQEPSSPIPSIIAAPTGTAPFPTDATAPLTTAAPPSVLTVLTVTNGFPDGSTTSKSLATLTITDSSQLASVKSAYSLSDAPAPSTTEAPVTVSTPSVSPAAASRSNSPNLSVLIPAIVAPVAIFLLIAFGLFWWFMRRRAMRVNDEEPEFIMEKRPRFRANSTDESLHSHSSTRNLVPITTELTPKEAALDIKEVARSSSDLSRKAAGFSPTGLGIGVARSPDASPIHSRQNSVEQSAPYKPPVQVRNFSRGPSRPGTATKESDPGTALFARDRSLSTSSSQAPTLARPDVRGRPSPIAEVASPYVSSPSVRGSPALGGPGIAVGSPAHRSGPSSQAAGLAGPRSEPIRAKNADGPSPTIQTQPHVPFKKASSLKEQWIANAPVTSPTFSPKAPLSPHTLSPNTRTMPPPPASNNVTSVKDLNSPTTPQSLMFSEENMRIARLANSSSMGFYKDSHVPSTVISMASSSQPSQSPVAPEPSPRLPPPATREMPPSKMNIPIPPPPPESTAKPAFLNDRRSVVSRMSSDDGYVDMEIDAKSDVSSLDERERWEMERDQSPHVGSRPAFS